MIVLKQISVQLFSKGWTTNWESWFQQYVAFCKLVNHWKIPQNIDLLIYVPLSQNQKTIVSWTCIRLLELRAHEKKKLTNSLHNLFKRTTNNRLSVLTKSLDKDNWWQMFPNFYLSFIFKKCSLNLRANSIFTQFFS